MLGDIELGNKKYYYGFKCSPNEEKSVSIDSDAKYCKKCKHKYSYNFVTYNHLGDYYCSFCGYKRPELNYSVDKIIKCSEQSSDVVFNGMEFLINLPGVYNIYNALTAFSIAKHFKITDETIKDSFKNQSSSFGRQESIKIGDKKVRIILVKNPAGFDEAINTLKFDNDKISAAFLLNDNYADGRDVSWIWDVNFEKLNSLSIGSVLFSGSRLYDMALRLKIAGLDENNFIFDDNYEELVNSIKNCSTEKIYVLATYTAMIDFRKLLYKSNIIKKLW